MKKLSKAYIGLVFAFLYLPIAVLIVFSFNSSKSRNVWEGFTLDWYRQLFTNETILSSLAVTLLVALIAAVCATILGTAAAIGIHSMNKTAKHLILNISYLPIVNPEIVTGVSLMMLFLFLGFKRDMFTLVLAHITFCVPYVILSVMPKLRQLNPNLYEAAQDLGCHPAKAFFHAVLPEIMPGVFSGFLMSFTYSVDDFVISYFTTDIQTLPVTIFSMTRRRVSPEINALSAVIFLVVLTVLIVMNVVDMRRAKKAPRLRHRGHGYVTADGKEVAG